MPKKKRPRRTKLTKLPAAPSEKVDPKLDAAWRSALSAIEEAQSRGAEAYDELWEMVGRVVHHDPPLYVLGGYKSVKDFCVRGLKTDFRTAMRNVEVAEHATPKEEETYGTSNVYAALEYIRAKFGKLNGTLPVAFERLKIPVREGKKTRTLAFKDATFAQIQAATRDMTKKPSPTDRTEAEIAKLLSKHPAFARVRFSVRAGLVDVRGVPLASLDTFARVLSTVKLPAPK
jgi:hypothetical protein